MVTFKYKVGRFKRHYGSIVAYNKNGSLLLFNPKFYDIVIGYSPNLETYKGYLHINKMSIKAIIRYLEKFPFESGDTIQYYNLYTLFKIKVK